MSRNPPNPPDYNGNREGPPPPDYNGSRQGQPQGQPPGPPQGQPQGPPHGQPQAPPPGPPPEPYQQTWAGDNHMHYHAPPPPTYHSEPERHYYAPPPPQYPPTVMAAVHHGLGHGPPHGQDPYRLPPPPPGYNSDPYGSPGSGPYTAAAPRQRTAIACRYCRRRKIRCSGFESSSDGRCTNCVRFNQECMFTPVSSQAQAFVPAHAAYPHLRNAGPRGSPVTLYGAHGQPLPSHQQPHQQPPGGPETTLPPPQGMYPPHYVPPLASSMPDPRQHGRRGSGSEPAYPDPTNLAPVTPTGSLPGFQNSSHYYAPQQDRRTSPQNAYPYEPRHSSSPHGSPYPPMQPPASGPTPPPSTATSTPSGSTRGGLNVRDMLNPGENPNPSGNSGDSHGRSSADSDMLNALNRRGPGQ
ncbi:hypothetical protein N7520_002959 [Penicillium odoratum]|uniref:uncharacterized protein n=1 Tax=Penicillium odoratum TaxID=1167516 RepID=UPI002547CD1F|nr:uncharacterized protein N7520_002959 [Penicillium odoratum]KAJ5772430.1 hypothetical protein N7520_002959 [Penicillium odoratum]